MDAKEQAESHLRKTRAADPHWLSRPHLFAEGMV
jgi:hypothetical protein